MPHHLTASLVLALGALAAPAQQFEVRAVAPIASASYVGVWWNHERQVSLPLPPHTGRTLRVEVWSRPGRATAQDVALLGIGAARRAPPLLGPFGALHVDALGALVPVAIAPDRGVAELDLPVPNVPALRGADLFFQALHSTPLGLHFSNLAIGRIE